jgi:misacylated tRNA(Ala) deacylase
MPRRATHRPPLKRLPENPPGGSRFTAEGMGPNVTELAYLPDMASAYVQRFSARIVALPPGAAVLDRTYFYPAGGGQPCDRGTLRPVDGGEVRVIDVAKSGSAVLHRVKVPRPAPPLRVGTQVEGTIDWVRRHRHMRLHTAQHFVSAQVFGLTRLRTRRAILAGIRATIDLEGPLAETLLPTLAAGLREAVERPRAVSIRMVTRHEWDRNPQSERSGLVPLPAQVDPVRVVEIAETDVCPCGGTHLRTTGEIGSVRFEPLARFPDGSSQVAFTLEDSEPSTPTG